MKFQPFYPNLQLAVDVGVPELFARHQIWRAFDDDSDFFRQFVFWFLLAAHRFGSRKFNPTTCAKTLLRPERQWQSVSNPLMRSN
jgi:hypothetical protein